MPSSQLGKSKRTSPSKKRSTAPRPEREASCHSGDEHPDHSYALGRLRRIQGQINGIESMILTRRYCPEIIIQFRAAESALKSLQMAVLETHLGACVKSAVHSKDNAAVEEKIREIIKLLSMGR